ncbi:MAG TPA: hypothetical protein VF544_01335 [Pyrinomonadaceae bacterium]
MRERINACRRRLRRSRAASRSGETRDRQERLVISIDEQSPVCWIEEDAAAAAVDHRAPPRARFKREEETVRA